MSQNAIVVQGIVKADGTLELLERLSWPAGRVQVVIHALNDVSADVVQDAELLETGEKLSPCVPRSAQEIAAEIQELDHVMFEQFESIRELDENHRQSRPHSPTTSS